MISFPDTTSGGPTAAVGLDQWDVMTRPSRRRYVLPLLESL